MSVLLPSLSGPDLTEWNSLFLKQTNMLIRFPLFRPRNAGQVQCRERSFVESLKVPQIFYRVRPQRVGPRDLFWTKQFRPAGQRKVHGKKRWKNIPFKTEFRTSVGITPKVLAETLKARSHCRAENGTLYRKRTFEKTRFWVREFRPSGAKWKGVFWKLVLMHTRNRPSIPYREIPPFLLYNVIHEHGG